MSRFKDEFPSGWEAGPVVERKHPHHTVPPTRADYGSVFGWLVLVGCLGGGLLMFSRRHHYAHQVENHKKLMVADVQMSSACREIKLYSLANGHLPSDLPPFFRLKENWLRSAHPGLDPWGHEYHLTGTPNNFSLTSPGPDGKWDTRDDLSKNVSLDAKR
jgi:hypothetical protein